MTRIIAGSAKGRRLEVPRSRTRPTADRVREAMFSTIGSHLAAEQRPWSTVAVLDLFAGSGALGLEAASRGACRALLVERSERAAATIRRNVAACGLPQVQLMVASALAMPARDSTVPSFDLGLVDPPYDIATADLRTGLSAVTAGWLDPRALLVVERPAREPEHPLPNGWTVIDQRTYGDTCLWYGHRTAD